MIFKLFTQVILASTLLQMFPVDARDLEKIATLPDSSERVVGTYSIFDLSTVETDSVRKNAPVKKDGSRLGIITTAVSALVMDRNSGAILFEKNRQTPRAIGSITKLMTAYVFLKTNPDLDAPASLIQEDIRLGGIQHIPLLEVVTIRDLFYASLVSSDNSATSALVRLSGMSEGDFVAKMNETAASIGMQQTQFVDPTGLSSKNTSIVTDLARLLDEAAKIETIKDATQKSTHIVNSVSGKTFTFTSTDDLLQSFMNQPPYKIIAAKTGFLPEAGYCLATLFSRNGTDEILVIVLGSDSDSGRFQDVKSLAAWAYDAYEW
ncbi:D-alanyl-D-alanine carboxypeptidase [Candidatus Uhrbacteria bacterium]|nr:D-alanyl-D-alanine carboxypeptidase [Candidatus Uhrbacteria bacterium]